LGRHNQANALAALALAEASGVPIQTAINTLRSYTGLPHRTQWVAKHQGVTWLNDSKATNVGAAIAALKGLDGSGVLIAGGQGKAADFSSLETVVEAQVKAVVLMGEDAQVLFRALKGSAAISLATDMQDAVSQAAKLASPGDYVLLSPACASFDQYSGYADRGETFIRCVEMLTGEGS
jgi:UDP-N-acetylmuramoylalanine--D-glutamate ligase